MTKAEVRKALLAQRALAQVREAPDLTGPTHAMAAWLGARLQPGQILGTYAPIKTERNPAPVQELIGAPLAFPKVMGAHQPLTFFEVAGLQDLERGAFGVLEPKAGLAAVRPDLVLVPLVGFDARGYRLGYGGGFYDRTLALYRGQGSLLAVGFAYDGQLSAQPLNFEATDLALDAVMTPTKVYDFQAGEVYSWS